MESQLRNLESQLNWCWHRYLLRVWQDCGSFNSATDLDRLQIAEEMHAEAEGRTQKWASAGLGKLLDHLISKLDDPDPDVRQDAAIAEDAIPICLGIFDGNAGQSEGDELRHRGESDIGQIER